MHRSNAELLSAHRSIVIVLRQVLSCTGGEMSRESFTCQLTGCRHRLETFMTLIVSQTVFIEHVLVYLGAEFGV